MLSARWIVYVILYDSDVESKCTISANFGIELLGTGKRLEYVQAVYYTVSCSWFSSLRSTIGISGSSLPTN